MKAGDPRGQKEIAGGGAPIAGQGTKPRREIGEKLLGSSL